MAENFRSCYGNTDETYWKRVADRRFERKTKWQSCYLLITDNHSKIVKKNTEHNYLIKTHKLNLNKKNNLHPLYVPKIVVREQHLKINVMGHCMNITSLRHF